MLEAILPGPTNRSDSVRTNPESTRDKYENDYEVDTISISTCRDDDGESYEEEDCAVVAAPPDHVPAHFESVSIVNSNDIHFGNKTIYKGPVTIKQFLYPNAENSNAIDNGVCLSVKDLCAVDNPTKEGVSNGAGREGRLGTTGQEAVVEIGSLRKGLKWFKSIQNWKRNKLFSLIVLLLALIVLSTLLTWRYLSGAKHLVVTTTQGDYISEEDKDTPVDYDPDTTAINSKVRIVNRLSWLAQPPAGAVAPLQLPVSLVIIQHTATESCTSQAACVFQTRTIQTFHIESKGWNDIAYNFLIGGDGDAYEGRGWTNQGAHTLGYNNISIGVAFIGTFNTQVPHPAQISAFKKLVLKGIDLGHITKDYKIIAARQLSTTESPGKTFFEDAIKKWPHWSEKP